MGASLPVMEAFYTLQGEGHHTGKAAYFIRLGGCDVGCVWCDVKESWDASKHPEKTVEEIVDDAKSHPGRIAVVTGGEPCMYDLKELTTSLRNQGFRTHLETSGAYAITGDWDWICVSPKKFKAPLDRALSIAHELKVVIYHRSDLAWATAFLSRISNACKRYLQPEWDRREDMTPRIIEHVKANPEWEISLQTHKFMDIP